MYVFNPSLGGRGLKLALDLFFGTIIVLDIILNLLLEDAY